MMEDNNSRNYGERWFEFSRNHYKLMKQFKKVYFYKIQRTHTVLNKLSRPDNTKIEHGHRKLLLYEEPVMYCTYTYPMISGGLRDAFRDFLNTSRHLFRFDNTQTRPYFDVICPCLSLTTPSSSAIHCSMQDSL